MNKVISLCLVLAVLAGLVAVSEAQQSTQAFTRVVLDDLHCMGCAKKINRKVVAVPGVAEMRVDLKAKTIWAMHKQGMTPSPKALWEAIEQADHAAVRLDSPSGSYTSKPQS
ncbi:MAG: heavy-metal-associated domain-containing protein [Gemmataceae bacterium]